MSFGYTKVTGMVTEYEASLMLRSPFLTQIAAFLSIFIPFIVATQGRPLPTNIGMYAKNQAWRVRITLDGRQYQGWLDGTIGKVGDALDLVVRSNGDLLAIYCERDSLLALPPDGGVGLMQFIRNLKYVAVFFGVTLLFGLVSLLIAQVLGGFGSWRDFGWIMLAFMVGGPVVYLVLTIIMFYKDLIAGFLTSIVAKVLGVADYWGHQFEPRDILNAPPMEGCQGCVFNWTSDS